MKKIIYILAISFLHFGLANSQEIEINRNLEVGTLPGSFGVSPTGAATYTIPIVLPEGRAGMTPKLAFTYNSQSPSTVMGQGWGISGFSSISRSNPTLYYNDEIDNIDFVNDQLMLDGNKLIKIGTEDGNIIYRTEIDEIAKVVYYAGTIGIDYFRVWTKTGLIKEYGKANDSRQTYSNQTEALIWHLNKVIDRNGNFVTYSYHKNEVNGELYPEQINYTWFENDTENYLATYTILFSYDQLDPTMYQIFLFENSNLENESSAFINSNTVRLSSVNVIKGTSDEDPKLKTYLLNYEDENTLAGEYFLREISLETYNTITGETKKLNPTLFNWHLFEPNLSKSNFEKPENEIVNYFAKYLLASFDIDGNGTDEIAEIIGHYSGNGFNPNKLHINFPLAPGEEFIIDLNSAFEGEYKYLIAGDFTNDGKDELVLSGVTNTKIYSFSQDNGSWNYESIWEIPGSYYPMLGDVDGNGLQDLLLVNEFEGFANLFLGTGDALNLFSNELYPIEFLFNEDDPFQDIVSLSDFNGDGKADIAIENRENFYEFEVLDKIVYDVEIYSLIGSVFGSLVSYPVDEDEDFVINDPTEQIGALSYSDFNGDGRTDIMFSNVSYPSSSLPSFNDTRLSYGKGFISGSSYNIEILDAYDKGAKYIMDQNNDGRADLIYLKFDNQIKHPDGTIEFVDPFIRTETFYTRPDGLYSASVVETTNLDAGAQLLWQSNLIIFADINGNGIVSPVVSLIRNIGDELTTNINPPVIREITLRMLHDEQSIAANVISSIRSGLGVMRQIQYYPSRLSFSGHGEYEYPYSLSKRKTWLVQQTFIEGNQENYLGHVSYAFRKPITMLRGKGMLGYSQVIINNHTDNIRTTKNYAFITKELDAKELYYIKYVESSIVEAIEDGIVIQTLSNQSNQLDIKNTVNGYNKIFIPVLTQSLRKTWDLDGSFVATKKSLQEIEDIDNWGNYMNSTFLLDKDSPLLDENYNFKTTTTSTYLIDEADWLVNRPESLTSTLFDYNAADEGDESLANYEYYLDRPHILKKKTVVPNSENKYLTSIEYEYDVFGNKTKETIDAPNFSEEINGETHLVTPRTTEYLFNTEAPNNGRFLTSVKNTSEGGVDYISDMLFDDITGHIDNSINAAGLQSTYEYNQMGMLVKTTSADNISSNSRLYWSIEHQDAPTNSQYYYYNYRIEAGSPFVMEKSIVFYDKFGRVLRNISYDMENRKVFVDYSYNSKGRLNSMSQPYFTLQSTPKLTLFSYDLLGRVETKTYPFGNILMYTYSGRSNSATNSGTGITITKEINPKGKLINVFDPAGNINYSYYSSGNLMSTNAVGSNTSFKYNAANMQTEINEPNSGKTLYIYNPFGELISQTDANNSQYVMYYDNLGRMFEKKLTNNNSVTQYVFNEETPPSGETGLGFGLLQEVIGPNGIKNKYHYDDLNRIISNNKTTPYGQSGQVEFVESYTYNPQTGRPNTYTYPSGLTVSYDYAQNGMMWKVNMIEGENETLIWENLGTNRFGQIIDFTLGNGVSTHKNIDDYGYLERIETYDAQNNDIQDLEYDFSAVTGNLYWRKDNILQNTESFAYDDLLKSRLEKWQVNDGQSFEIDYDNNGNISTKSDVTIDGFGHYGYTSWDKPNAVVSITIPEPEYAVNNGLQNITYTAFNKIESIEQNANENILRTQFYYGPDNRRTSTTTYKNEIVIQNKYFIMGNYEIEVDERGAQRKLHYINGGDGLFAIYEWVRKPGAMDENKRMFYIHKDHLGSYETITDEDGVIVEKLNFDPWGRRRNPLTWTFENVPQETLFDRGYTGHQHMDKYNLINMNGRLYDPWLGRMLSSDPILQAPTNSQNYNRYTYALNNPLKYTDPSGYRYGPNNLVDENGMRYKDDMPGYSETGEYSHNVQVVDGTGRGWSMGFAGNNFNNNGFSNSTESVVEVLYDKDGNIVGTKVVTNTNTYDNNFNTIVSSKNRNAETESDAEKVEENVVLKALALFLRESPILPSGSLFGFVLNPFYGAEAIFMDAGITHIATEIDGGVFFILTGDNIGDIVPYGEFGKGGSTEVATGIELGRVDLWGTKESTFNRLDINGGRHKFWLSGSPTGGIISGGINFAINSFTDSRKVTYSGISIGFGQSLFGIVGFGYNYGETITDK